MAAADSATLETHPTVCAACGKPLAAGANVITLDDRALCNDCAAREDARVELKLDRDGVLADAGARYECSTCRRLLPIEQLYENNGALICTDCWATRQATANGLKSDDGTRAAPVVAPGQPRRLPPRAPLLARVTCPHCWRPFAPQDVLWIATHPDLIGDDVAGPGAALRFLPSRFSLDGMALDARQNISGTLACPTCHLVVPRAVMESETMPLSIAGAVGSGKSTFLAAMTWELRRMLALQFGVSFNDAEPSFNRTLNANEEAMFLPNDPDRLTQIPRTLPAGSSATDAVRIARQHVNLPRPLLFTMRPSGRHPHAAHAAHLARVICFYDHGGEDFEPGADDGPIPVTRHLGASRAMFFLFDPTADPRFRSRLRGMSDDPQLAESWPTRRADVLLIEAAARVRRFAGLPTHQPLNRPLLVIVPKADTWGRLIGLDLSREPIVGGCVADGALAGVDLDRIEQVSKIVREMLLETAPEFVAAAEAFSANVVYIPVSALGAPGAAVDGREGLWIRPSEVRPQWVTAPFLYMFARWTHDLIARVRWERSPGAT